MNPYNPCDECSQDEAEHKLPEIINKNEIVINALINDGSTVLNNLIAFNDKQIGQFAKQVAKHFGKLTAGHDDLITDLVSLASSAMQQIIGENQVKVDLLANIFDGVAATPQVQPVSVQVNTGSAGPQPVSVTTIQNTSPPPLPQSTSFSPPESRQIPSPYTSEIGGQSSVSVSVNPVLSQLASTVTSTDEGTTVVFAPTVTNTHTILRQAVEQLKERQSRREAEGEQKKGESFPVDPQADPVSWKFAPDDTKWRVKSAVFLGPAYELLLHVDSMEEYQKTLDTAFEHIDE
jgi:hypothetical protein